MLFKINCNVAIEVIQLNCTGGDYYGLILESMQTLNPLENFYIAIVHSYFDRNAIGISVLLGCLCI